MINEIKKVEEEFRKLHEYRNEEKREQLKYISELLEKNYDFSILENDYDNNYDLSVDEEDRLIRYFETVKKIEQEGKLPVFLSKRFYQFYKIMLDKNKVSQLNDYYYVDEISNYKGKKVYLNDFNYGIGNLKYNESLFINYYIPNISRFSKDVIGYPFMTEKDYEKTKNLVAERIFKKKRNGCNTLSYEDFLIQMIIKEIHTIYENGHKNIIELVPDFWQNYFMTYSKHDDALNEFVCRYLIYKLLYISVLQPKSFVWSGIIDVVKYQIESKYGHFNELDIFEEHFKTMGCCYVDHPKIKKMWFES